MNFTGDKSALRGAPALPLLTSFKALFLLFLFHPVGGRGGKSDKITLIFTEHHTGEAAESFLTPAAF